MRRAAFWLFITIPGCLAAGWYAVRAMGEMQRASSASLVTTIEARPVQSLELPAPGVYWAVAIGSPEAMQVARAWTPALVDVETGDSALIDMGDPQRTSRRRDRGGLDLLFTMRVPAAGTYRLTLFDDTAASQGAHLRITQFSRASAGVAMRAMAAGVTFSVLLLVSAAVWFRRR